MPRLIASPDELREQYGTDAGTTIVMSYAGEELSSYQIRHPHPHGPLLSPTETADRTVQDLRGGTITSDT